MATPAESASSPDISEITKCSICSKTFRQPKLLPCFHTFCLPCLKNIIGKKKQSEMPCPLCSKVFTIPPPGIAHLSDNFFINQLLLQQNDETKSAKRLKLAGDYCNKHPGEENNLYCADCKTIVCPKCVSKHNNHKLSDVSETAKEFKKQMHEDANIVTLRGAAKKQNEIEQLVTEENNFTQKVAMTENAISQRYDELISVMQSHTSQLLEELKEFKEKIVEKAINKKDDIERNIAIKESFVGYCSEIMEKGTPGTICRTAHDLRTRAEEFGMTGDKHDNQHGNDPEVAFTPSHSIVDNPIGRLQLNFSVEDTPKILNALSFMDNPRLHGVACATGYVIDIAVLGNELFVATHEASVGVFVTDSLKYTRKLKISLYMTIGAIVASRRFACLFISSSSPHLVNRYNLSDDVISNWPLDAACNSLSMTSTDTVLVLVPFIHQVKEYTAEGILVREVSIDGSIVNPSHCIQLSNDRLIVSHGLDLHDKSHNRVCVLDLDGRVIHSYGGSKGSAVGRLNTPSSVAVDRFGNVLVSDRENLRLIFLSPTLTYLGTKRIPEYQHSRPGILYLDQLTRRLYIAEWPCHRRRVFVLTV